MSIYTYVVDHGDDSPAIHANMDINGGRCIGVTFDNLQDQAELMEEKLNRISEVVDHIDCFDTKHVINQILAGQSLEAIDDVLEDL